MRKIIFTFYSNIKYKDRLFKINDYCDEREFIKFQNSKLGNDYKILPILEKRNNKRYRNYRIICNRCKSSKLLINNVTVNALALVNDNVLCERCEKDKQYELDKKYYYLNNADKALSIEILSKKFGKKNELGCKLFLEDLNYLAPGQFEINSNYISYYKKIKIKELLNGENYIYTAPNELITKLKNGEFKYYIDINNSNLKNEVDRLSEYKLQKFGHKRKCKENVYLSYIEEKFKNLKSIRQFTVPKEDRKVRILATGKKRMYGGFYKIDLYFPDIKLAIECDEYGHRDRSAWYEKEREQYISNKLNCKFIRFNPDCSSFSIKIVIEEINKYIKGVENNE